MNPLDPDIASLFEAQEAPPRDPAFVARVTRRIGWMRAAPGILFGSATLAAALCVFFAGPPLMQTADRVAALFTQILASPWTAGGLAVAAASMIAPLYLLRTARL